ncbi:hypothetical protein RJT34_14432 [Clitoria ternatea]|uniref:Uncharacterized protein n=1 Tax=Clitoria ternatea TaxID=43366 RepID=A0AAN9JQD4_CLITE
MQHTKLPFGFQLWKWRNLKVDINLLRSSKQLKLYLIQVPAGDADATSRVTQTTSSTHSPTTYAFSSQHRYTFSLLSLLCDDYEKRNFGRGVSLTSKESLSFLRSVLAIKVRAILSFPWI